MNRLIPWNTRDLPYIRLTPRAYPPNVLRTFNCHNDEFMLVPILPPHAHILLVPYNTVLDRKPGNLKPPSHIRVGSPIDKDIHMSTWLQDAISLLQPGEAKSAVVGKRQIIIGENLKTGFLTFGLSRSSKFQIIRRVGNH